MGVTHPIAPSETRVGTITHPYFTFEVPGVFGPTVFQWQIHPKENGPLRYTLVAVSPSELEQLQLQHPQEGPTTAKIRAIYHHIGLGASLSQSYSEGVLLLPPLPPRGAEEDGGKSNDDDASEWEGVIVASLLTMLWRLRKIDGGKGSSNKTKTKTKTNTQTKTSGDGTGSSLDGKTLSFFRKLKGEKSSRVVR